jgi:hypothetical protein
MGKDWETNRLAVSVVKILVPVVGDIVAKAMLEKQCGVIGIEPAKLMKENMEQLAKRIEHVLVIFGHDEKEVCAKIRALK